jgi:hypothetical protein
MVEAFEGNQAETDTMIPTIEAFKQAHRFKTQQGFGPTDCGGVSH